MQSANPSSGCLPQSFLLSIADDLVRVFQSLIAILNGYYESNLSSPDITTSLDLIKLACDDIHQHLSVLWPCEKQFVAVLGCTGCGKSTLLNLLLSMLCSYGTTYTQGIKADSFRAILRDSARIGAEDARNIHARTQIQDEDASEEPEVLMSEVDSTSDCISDDLLCHEQAAFEGVLGISCAKDRHSYMNKHIPIYDRHPFILRNGRMGDAGTTKVTSVVYGPKFIGHLRWMTRKKMRRKLRDLRQMLDSGDQTASMDEQLLLELKEFWQSVRELVSLPSSAERPTEEQINMVVNDLGTKRKLLDKEERIETSITKGCSIDRAFVREGIKMKLDHQLGKLVEDLRIEVPISSFEGGISLLDVPGTNDPRVLHQRETRDAIDRTSLILLVLDKSVMDNQTQSALAESPLLERMLMDEFIGCSLVVVAIAEKNTQKGQSPKDVLAGFDSKENVLRTLKKVFQKIASKLCKSKRIQKEIVLKRIEELFTTSITLIPVLPFLCASLHLSPSNPALHKTFCQSGGQINCPLKMTKEELKERCKETNIPYLLEKIHSVRVPPAEKDLKRFMDLAIDGLRLLTKQNMVSSSYTEFLKSEQVQAYSVSSEEVLFIKEPVRVDIRNSLLQCADECKLELSDINEICESVEEDLPSQLQKGSFPWGSFILGGFGPEVIGKKANNLLSSVDEESKCYTNDAFKYLFSIRGHDAYIDATFEKLLQVDDGSLVLALGLHEQLNSKWSLSLHRLRAKCFCGGIDGGLLSQVRGALRKAYDAALKYLAKELKRSKDLQATLRYILENNALGVRAAQVAELEVNKALVTFWKNLSQSLNAEMQFLWKSWQADIGRLAKSAQKILEIQKVRKNNSYMLDDPKAEYSLFQKTLKAKEEELQVLKKRLEDKASQLQDIFEYGYSLLQSDCAVDMMIKHKRSRDTVDGPSPMDEIPFKSNSGKTKSQSSTVQRDMPGKRVSGSVFEDAAVQISKEIGMANSHQAVLETLHGRDAELHKKETQVGFVDKNREELPESSSTAINLNRLGSFLGKNSRKAQFLSDAEAVSLQKRASSANKRLKK